MSSASRGPPGPLRPLPRIRDLRLRGRTAPHPRRAPLAGNREPRTLIRGLFIPAPVSGAPRSWEVPAAPRGSRCRAVPGAAAGRAVRSLGRAAGRRPCPQAVWVPQRWLSKRQFWFLFLGVRFSLFSLMRGPCGCSTRVVRVLPPRLSWSGVDGERNKS